jgi:hypothetical protein
MVPLQAQNLIGWIENVRKMIVGGAKWVNLFKKR